MSVLFSEHRDQFDAKAREFTREVRFFFHNMNCITSHSFALQHAM